MKWHNPENKPMCYTCTRVREENAADIFKPIFCQEEFCFNFDERKWPQIYNLDPCERVAARKAQSVDSLPKKNQVVLFYFNK